MYLPDFVMLWNKINRDITWLCGEDKICICKQTCNVLFIFFNEIPNWNSLFKIWTLSQTNSDQTQHAFAWGIDGNMSFSHVKIPLFCVGDHLIFHWSLYNKHWSPISVLKFYSVKCWKILGFHLEFIDIFFSFILYHLPFHG